MLKAVFSDDYLMVIEKPAGLVVTSSQTTNEKTLEDILKEDFNLSLERSGIVHRLDKDTSGLLLVAKKLEVMQKLQAQFKGRGVKKEYLTLCHGFIEKPGKIEAFIARNPVNREKFIVQPCKDQPCEAREAVTEYEPKKLLVISSQFMEQIFEGFSKIQFRKLRTMNYEQFTLLRCFPLTGRTHQIRVHLKYINHPVVGDEKYAGRKVARLDKRWCPRQFLHAAKLEFTHPATGERLSFESKLPEDLEKALGMLEKA
ncbi:MAG: RluA family pseudouridine synthase [Candidatus Daviesbacteria bacterium]